MTSQICLLLALLAGSVLGSLEVGDLVLVRPIGDIQDIRKCVFSGPALATHAALTDEGPGWIVDIDPSWFRQTQVLFQSRRNPRFVTWFGADVFDIVASDGETICRDYQGLAHGTVVGFYGGDGTKIRRGIVLGSTCSRFQTYLIRPLGGLWWEQEPVSGVDESHVFPIRIPDFV